jgi:L,D-peptidoglycan transpeptidase YkuD (ErfK/YbiS/YcfS/YnhG family)
MKFCSLCRVVAVCGGLLLCAMNIAAEQAQKQQPLHDSLQMVVVTTPDWNAVDGRLQRYERDRPGTQWKRVGEPIEIVVGKNGMGWGVGLVSTGTPGVRGATDPVKKEGDGKSPAGAFRFSSAFGYAAQAPAGWKLPYIPLTATVECVDDSGSRFYNRIVDRTTVSPDWHSSEHMATAGVSYRWGAVIDNNANPATPGVGSCVFMHVWGGAGVGTAGCTAIPQAQLEPILAWLDPAARPVLVQLPMAQYKKLKKLWRLP